MQLLVRFLISDVVVGVDLHGDYCFCHMVTWIWLSRWYVQYQIHYQSAGALLSSYSFCSVLVSFASLRRFISRHMYANKGGDGALPWPTPGGMAEANSSLCCELDKVVLSLS